MECHKLKDTLIDTLFVRFQFNPLEVCIFTYVYLEKHYILNHFLEVTAAQKPLKC